MGHSPSKSKTYQPHKVVNDCEERDDESSTQTAMQVIETDQPSIDTDTDAHWVKKRGKPAFDYKQHTKSMVFQ